MTAPLDTLNEIAARQRDDSAALAKAAREVHDLLEIRERAAIKAIEERDAALARVRQLEAAQPPKPPIVAPPVGPRIIVGTSGRHENQPPELRVDSGDWLLQNTRVEGSVYAAAHCSRPTDGLVVENVTLAASHAYGVCAMLTVEQPGVIRNVTVRNFTNVVGTRRYAWQAADADRRDVEGGIRLAKCDDVLIEDTTLDYRDDLGAVNAAPLRLQSGNRHHVRRCTLFGTTIRIGPLAEGDGGQRHTGEDRRRRLAERLDGVLIEDNVIMASMALVGGATNIVIKGGSIEAPARRWKGTFDPRLLDLGMAHYPERRHLLPNESRRPLPDVLLDGVEFIDRRRTDHDGSLESWARVMVSDGKMPGTIRFRNCTLNNRKQVF